MDGRVLEREHELSVLTAAAHQAARGAGSAVCVTGEAGIGKSSLVESIRARLPRGSRMLVGLCDDLSTRRTLGPLRDLLGTVDAELSAALRQGSDRERVLSALRAELDRPARPTVLVVEDVHWADEATLDALRFLMRRIRDLPALLVITYRDDEVGPDHPVQALLELGSRLAWVSRVQLAPLTLVAVRQLCAGTAFDADRVHAGTGGNPFFVTETIAAGRPEVVPSTITDAVLGRVGRLGRDTREVLEQLAVVPSGLDRTLVETLTPRPWRALAEAERHGLVLVNPAGVAFRHEVTRRSIADSVPAARAVELHTRVLGALVEAGAEDLAAVLHHAAAAGDVEAIRRYAPRAGREAARAGAHREAAAHLGLALEHAGHLADQERAMLLEELAFECYTTGAAARAVAAQQEAVALRRQLGGAIELGAALRWLSRFHWWNGERAAAEESGDAAIGVLSGAGDDRLLALALSNRSQLHAIADETAASIALGERAAALARELGDAEILTHALTNTGSARWLTGDRDGQGELGQALQVAVEAGETEHALRAYTNIASCLIDEYRLAEADPYLDAGIALADAADHGGFLEHLSHERSRVELFRGRWDDALRLAAPGPASSPPLRWGSLMITGRVGVRRGDPGAVAMLEEAWELAVDMAELQRTFPVAVGLTEAALLQADPRRAWPVIDGVYAQAARLGLPALVAELGYWAARAGRQVPPGDGTYPYGLQAAGRWQAAAAAWAIAGCPYERAAALAESPDPDALLEALGILQGLGAQPLARQVTARLRDLGVTHLPRGPAAPSRGNPAGLTARQQEVTELLAQGLTNAEIADRLIVSVRTVESHVAAILTKLGAHDRRDAVARAQQVGAAGLRGRPSA